MRELIAAELEHFAAMLGDEIAELRRHERKRVDARIEKLRDEIAALRAESRAHNELVQLRAEIEALRGERAKVIDMPNPLVRRGAA